MFVNLSEVKIQGNSIYFFAAAMGCTHPTSTERTVKLEFVQPRFFDFG